MIWSDERRIFVESGNPLGYDILSFNLGSYVPATVISEDKGDIFSVKPIESLLEAQKRILQLLSAKEAAIDVVGGGPSAAEISGNLWRLARISGKAAITSST